RAAERVGLVARVVKRPLKALSSMVLPAVLILEGDQACVLVDFPDDEHASVMLPETGAGVQTIDRAALAEIFAGFVIYLRPEFDFAATADEKERAATSHWLWGPILKNWWIYGQVIIAAVLINIFALATPLFIMTVYDRVVPNNATETMWVLAIGAAIVFGFDFVVRSLRGYYLDTAGKRADVLMSTRIFNHVLDMQLAARPASSGAFANTLREFESVRDFFTSATLAALVDLPFVLLFIGVIWAVAGNVAIIPLVAVPLVLVIGLAVQVPLTVMVRRSMREANVQHGVLYEVLGGIETIKSLGADGRMRKRWEGFVARSARSNLRTRFLSMMTLNLTATVQQIATIAVVVLGVLMIGRNELTVGALIAAVILNGRAVGALGNVAQLLVRMHHARTALKALNVIMSIPVERPALRKFLHRPRLRGAIDFRDVTFTYPEQPVAALRGVSFSIAPGERVGLVGRLGSGKSTIQKLILGLYHPQEGSILMDGTELRQIDPVDLRRNLGAVPQDVFLLSGSVRENLTIGAPHASDAAILRASHIAGVDEWVRRHPMGYDLEVGERGERISQGQRQSIAIARSLLLDPPIYLMDEPTSSMDNPSETVLKKNLEKLLPGRTLLLVTHRTSLLSIVDRLIVLDQGAVVADGPREDVLKDLADGQVRRQAS
ncbi:MAG: type I secretion system permease/ATPase, partial [Planctomycetes bacterium]|nr:type I secretion system permease/ATPase [Planctomycetota bacterium]